MVVRTDKPAQDRFRVLFDEHHEAVARYVRRRLPADDVDDVVAETFLVAWRRLAEVPGEPRGWLLGVARNVGANRSRTTRRQHSLAERLAAQPEVRAGVAAHDELEDEPALRAFHTLSEADRETIALVTWDDLSPREAAGVLGCSYPAFRARLHRARRRLEARLDEQTAADRPSVVGAKTASAEIGGAR